MNLTISPISFQSRNAKIKKADDLMRKSNRLFPTFSPSRHDLMYRNSITHGVDGKYLFALMKKSKSLKLIRDENVYNYKEHNLAEILTAIKKSKLGNCYEKSIALLSLLKTNGYNNSQFGEIDLYITIKNNITNQIEIIKENLDHTFVLLKDEDKDIILDPWFDICGYKDEMTPRYKTLLSKEIKRVKDKRLAYYSIFYADDYEIIDTKLKIQPDYCINSNYLKKVDFNELKKKFPEIIINH